MIDDTCTECSLAGNDYYTNEYGKLECACSSCIMFSPYYDEWDYYDD